MSRKSTSLNENPFQVLQFQNEADFDQFIDYEKGTSYWSSLSPTLDSVMGGYGEKTGVPAVDVVGSKKFLDSVNNSINKNRKPNDNVTFEYALDVGAGYVSRITYVYTS